MTLLIILIVLALLVVLAAVLLVNALRLRPAEVANPLPPLAAEVAGTDRSVERFCALLQSKTVWAAEDPTADHSAFDGFIPKLKTLYPQVFAALELTVINDYGLLLHWRGRNAEAAPVVLMAHHDVVFAKPEEWTHDPFAAEIVDGRIYARGAVDTKCILAGLLEAVEYLLAQGYTPPRSVYLVSSNCEEDSGPTGKLMADYFSSRGITPLFVLDEGGAVVDNAPLGVSCDFAAIGVAEKGIFAARCTVESEGGHAATPALTDAPARLVAALDTMLKSPAPARLSKPIEETLKELAAHGSLGLKLVFANLWLTRPLVLAIMKGNAETAAMVRTTYAITELEGSRAANVIPKTAGVTVNVRIDPHENVDAALERLKGSFAKVGVAGDMVDFTLENPIDPSPVSPFDDEVFCYVRRVTHSVYPQAGIAPYVQSSCTDARHFATICPHTYRFAGFLFKGDQRASIHGKDESLDVESFKRGVGFYIQLMAHLDQLEGYLEG
ncbi:MAG: M20/M25/M40 family metallo-hydrolase [Coriobacteriales bacterium]|jgi:carboxypeptidase PM20D1|nr:M20/M25/M40 family metallo-hydrolase [Coriobacteriales bacterium]